MQPIFPREVTSGAPRITLTGNDELLVEQHHGLVAYTPAEIALRTNCGLLRVTGDGLSFTRYTSQEACIAGRITGLSLAGEGGRS